MYKGKEMEWKEIEGKKGLREMNRIERKWKGNESERN